MTIYRVTTVYYDNKNIQHQNSEVSMVDSDIKNFAKNYKDVKWDGVKNIVYDKDSRRIIQAGGYTPERGLFCDLY